MVWLAIAIMLFDHTTSQIFVAFSVSALLYIFISRVQIKERRVVALGGRARKISNRLPFGMSLSLDRILTAPDKSPQALISFGKMSGVL